MNHQENLWSRPFSSQMFRQIFGLDQRLTFKDFLTVKVFSKSSCVDLLESASLRVVILVRIRSPTLESPQTPRKAVSGITLGVVVVVLIKEKRR